MKRAKTFSELRRGNNPVKYRAPDSRPSSSQRGYNSTWQKARRGYLNKHPLCVECKRAGNIREAKVVDHIIPHKGDKLLFWDSSNWQALCITCHNRKTAKEDGGFGHNCK